MQSKVFLAGATGAIGRRLVPLLLDAGYEVFGTTRSQTKAAELQAAGAPPLHVDAAAQAALLALERAKPGVFNIAEDSGFVSIVKARRELGWDPDFRLEAQHMTRSA